MIRDGHDCRCGLNTTIYKTGEKVFFGRTHGEKTLGEVVRVNRVNLKVRQLESRGTFTNYPVGTLWTVPASFCSKADGSVSVPEPKQARPEAEIIRDIRNLYSRLSPENLSCDGELPMSQVRRRAAAFRRQLQACFNELGRQVSEDEAYK